MPSLQSQVINTAATNTIPGKMEQNLILDIANVLQDQMYVIAARKESFFREKNKQ
jgi:hypothetical protein